MKVAESHEWITLDGEIGTVGITNYAAEQLGEIVYLQLPDVNAEVKAGEEVATLESTKAAADVYSPVSGQIIEVNESLTTEINAINEDPEKTGWLYKLRIFDRNELDRLLDQGQYMRLVSRKS